MAKSSPKTEQGLLIQATLTTAYRPSDARQLGFGLVGRLFAVEAPRRKHQQQQYLGVAPLPNRIVCRGVPVQSPSHRTNLAMPLSTRGGAGVFKVRVAWHKLTGQRVAVKTYEKAKIKVRSEIPIPRTKTKALY